MTEINKPGRVIHKHDTEENWLKAVNFIPKQAEIVVYDIDSSHDYERFKIGDGVTNVNDLPFSSEPVQSDYAENDEYSSAYIKNRLFGDFKTEEIDITGGLRTTFSWFSYVGPSTTCLLKRASYAITLQPGEFNIGDNIKVITDNGIIEGPIELGFDETGAQIYYVGEVYLSSDSSQSSFTYEKIMNYSGDELTPRACGLSWSYNSTPPSSVFCYGLSSVTIESILINSSITKLSSEYTTYSKSYVLDYAAKTIAIDNKSDYYNIVNTGSNLNVSIDDSVPDGVIKYLNIKNVNEISFNLSSDDLCPVSLNGETLTTLAQVANRIDGTNSICLQIIIDRFYDKERSTSYKAKWNILGYRLPKAEDYLF
jgi:hypothetical protein